MSNKQLSPTRPWNFLWVVAVYGILYVPIVIFFVFSFNKAPFPAPWRGFTLDWYQELFTSAEVWGALVNSLIVSCSAVVLSCVMGVFFLFWASQGGRVQRLIPHFYANLMFPEIVLAVGLLGFFTFFSLPLGVVTLVVAHTVLGLGYVVPLLQARYGELDYRLTEAALDLGASPFQTFLTVILPLLRPALMTAAILVFIVSFDDFIFAYFCSGSTFQTLPMYILSMLRVGVSPVVNALSTVLLLFCSLLIALYSSFKFRIG